MDLLKMKDGLGTGILHSLMKITKFLFYKTYGETSLRYAQ